MRSSKIFLITSLMVASSAYADDVTVKVKGKITPPACQATIVGGETLDWGTISHSDLSSGFTFLPRKEVMLKIQCDAGLTTKMSFYTKDGNAASAMPGGRVPGTSLDNGESPERIYGIGMDPVTNEKIGNFTLVSKTSSYDGTENKTQFGFAGKGSGASTGVFATAVFGWGQNHNEEWTVLDDKGQPASANVFTFTFDAVPQINFKSKITNTQEVLFSGSAHFTVAYF